MYDFYPKINDNYLNFILYLLKINLYIIVDKTLILLVDKVLKNMTNIAVILGQKSYLVCIGKWIAKRLEKKVK